MKKAVGYLTPFMEEERQKNQADAKSQVRIPTLCSSFSMAVYVSITRFFLYFLVLQFFHVCIYVFCA